MIAAILALSTEAMISLTLPLAVAAGLIDTFGSGEANCFGQYFVAALDASRAVGPSARGCALMRLSPAFWREGRR